MWCGYSRIDCWAGGNEVGPLGAVQCGTSCIGAEPRPREPLLLTRAQADVLGMLLFVRLNWYMHARRLGFAASRSA